MKTQLLRGQKITAVFATDNQYDENLVALQPIRGYKHLTASMKMTWTETPRWKLETTEADFLDGFGAKSLQDDHTDSSVSSDLLQTLDRDTMNHDPRDSTIMPFSTMDTRLNNLSLGSGDDCKTTANNLLEESSDASSVVSSSYHSADSIESRDIRGPVDSTSATEDKSRPTLAAIVAQHTKTKSKKTESTGRTNIPEVRVPSQAEFTFVTNKTLPKMPVAIVTEPSKTRDKPKPASTSMCLKTLSRGPDLPSRIHNTRKKWHNSSGCTSNQRVCAQLDRSRGNLSRLMSLLTSPARKFIPLVRAIRQAGLHMTPAQQQQIDRSDVGAALKTVNAWPIGKFRTFKTYVKVAAAEGWVTTGGKDDKAWVGSSGRLESRFLSKKSRLLS